MAVAFLVLWSSGYVGAALAVDTSVAPATLLAWRYVVTASVLILACLTVPRARHGLAHLSIRDVSQQGVFAVLSHVVYLGGLFLASARDGGRQPGCALRRFAAGTRLAPPDARAEQSHRAGRHRSDRVRHDCPLSRRSGRRRHPSPGSGDRLARGAVGPRRVCTFIWCLRNLGSTPTSTLLYLSAPVTMLWAWATFGQVPVPAQWIGLATVLSGVALSLDLRRHRRRPARAPGQPPSRSAST